MNSFNNTKSTRLRKLLISAKSNIRKALAIHGTSFYVGTSGGKDSMAIKSLVSEVLLETTNDVSFDVVHNSKPYPFTHPLTQAYIYYKLSTEYPIMLLPSAHMPEYCKSQGYTLQFDGTRTAEFDREEKSDDFIRDGVSVNRTQLTPYIKNGVFEMSVSYPIYDWLDSDVFEYLQVKGIYLSGEYEGEYPLIWEDTNHA